MKKKEEISHLIEDILFTVLSYSLGYLGFWLVFPFSSVSLDFLRGFTFGSFFLILGTYGLYQVFLDSKKIISHFLERRRKREEISRKREPEIKREEVPKIKPPADKEKTFLELPERVSIKGEVMRELGLSYEKPEKPVEEEKEILPEKKKDEELEKRKIISFLESRGVLEKLEREGQILVKDNDHLGGVRGAEIPKEISILLKRIGISETKVQGYRLFLLNEGVKRKIKQIRRSLK